MTGLIRGFLTVALFASCIGAGAQPVRKATAVIPEENSAVVDLNLFSAPELRIYSASCDSMISAALARGDTENALGWARVRSAVAVRLNSLEAAPGKAASPTRELPPKRYFTRVKKKEVQKPKETVTPSPVQAGPTPTMEELVRQYRALKEKN